MSNNKMRFAMTGKLPDWDVVEVMNQTILDKQYWQQREAAFQQEQLKREYERRQYEATNYRGYRNTWQGIDEATSLDPRTFSDLLQGRIQAERNAEDISRRRSERPEVLLGRYQGYR